MMPSLLCPVKPVTTSSGERDYGEHHVGRPPYSCGRRNLQALDRPDLRPPRSSQIAVVVSNTGTELPGRRTVALRGMTQVHRDRGVVLPTIERLAPRLAPDDPKAFIRLLDSPHRVVIEVAPTRITASHDSTRRAGDGRGGQLNA